MKHYDTSSKSIIKNLVSLIASALVLIAATFAWFSHGSTTEVSSVGASMVSIISVDFFTATTPEEDVLWGMDGDDLFVRNTTSKADTILSTYLTDLDSSLWSAAAERTLPLYPGEFYSFKLSFDTNMDKNYLIAFTDAVLTSDEAEAMGDNVFVYSYARCTGTDGTVTNVTAVKSLSDLLSDNGKAVSIAANSHDHVDVYCVVGMPGMDLTGTQSIVQPVGGTFGFTAIEVE